MEGILEGLLYVQGDTGLTLKEVMSILSLTEEEALKGNIEEQVEVKEKEVKPHRRKLKK